MSTYGTQASYNRHKRANIMAGSLLYIVLFYHLPKTIGAISLFILIMLFSGSIILPTIVIGIFVLIMVFIEEHKAIILKEQHHKRDELKREQQLRWDKLAKERKARNLIIDDRLAKIGVYRGHKYYHARGEDLIKTLENIHRLTGKI